MEDRKHVPSPRKPHHYCPEWHDLNIQVLNLKSKIISLEKLKLDIEIREARLALSK